ncbi:hypothetical protein [Colwellia piezophila]|nr:hypothetical protein [Colwellia piezophila]
MYEIRLNHLNKYIAAKWQEKDCYQLRIEPGMKHLDNTQYLISAVIIQ